MFRLWCITALMLAGCMGSGPGPEVEPVDEPGASEQVADLGALPDWTAGRSWSYRTAGFWDATDSITVIAVPDGDGWMLAGSSPEDLIDEVAWDHWHYGPVDLTDRDGVLIAFPLEDGATWTLHGQELVAEAANITWVGGTEPGFRARDAEGSMLVEYAPSVGFVTRFEGRWDGDLAFGLELTGTGMASSWTSVEVLAEGVASGASAHATLEVPPEADEVLAWMLTSRGSSNFVTPPPGGPMPQTFEGNGGYGYEVAHLEAAQGTWLFGGGGTGTDTYMQLHAIDWVEGTI